VNLDQARALAVASRENTAAGLEAREQLANVVDQLAGVVETAYACKIAQRSVRPLVDKNAHTPARVRAYLLANGWTCERQHARSSDWRHEDGHLLTHLLDDDKFSDYEKVTAFLVAEAAITAGTGELKVLADIVVAGDE
jgi:hypothetical protein